MYMGNNKNPNVNCTNAKKSTSPPRSLETPPISRSFLPMLFFFSAVHSFAQPCIHTHMCIQNTCFSFTSGTRLFYARIDIHLQTFFLMEKKKGFAQLRYFAACCSSKPLSYLPGVHTSKTYIYLPCHSFISLFCLYIFVFFFPSLSSKLLLLICISRHASQLLSSSNLIKVGLSKSICVNYLGEKCSARLTDTVSRQKQNSANNCSHNFERKKNECAHESQRKSFQYFPNNNKKKNYTLYFKYFIYQCSLLKKKQKKN